MVEYTHEDLRDHDAIGAVITDEHERILVQDHVKYGFWTIPIGKAKNGQSPEDAMCQEVHEECGITVEDYEKIAQKDYIYERGGTDVHLTSHIFRVTKYSGEVYNAEPAKHRSQEFKTLDEILRFPYISDATMLYLRTIGKKRNERL